MKSAVLLTGIPGTGKSTIAKLFMKEASKQLGEKFEFFKESLVIGHRAEDLIVFGDYQDDAEIFPGTDRMSMAVSPEFQDFVMSNSPRFLLEGDRLVGNKTIDFLIDSGYDLTVIHLDVDRSTIEARYVARGSNQDPQFLKSKETKVSNIATRMDLSMDGILIQMTNQTTEDAKEIVDLIMKKLSV